MGTQIFEDVSEIAPGVTDETSPKVETKISEQEINETLDDGTWLKKKVKLTKVEVVEKVDEIPISGKVPSDKKVETDKDASEKDASTVSRADDNASLLLPSSDKISNQKTAGFKRCCTS